MNATQQKKLSGELQADLQALLDDALKECSRLKEKHDLAVSTATMLAEKMEIVAKERDEEQDKLHREIISHHKAQAIVAEMRNALERVRFVNAALDKPISEQIKENEALWFHALSIDCGKGWKSPEQIREMLEPTVELLSCVTHGPEEAWYEWLNKRNYEIERLSKIMEDK